MSSDATFLRLRSTDPGRWQALAAAWRRWADLAAQLLAELTGHLREAGWAGTSTAGTGTAGTGTAGTGTARAGTAGPSTARAGAAGTSAVTTGSAGTDRPGSGTLWTGTAASAAARRLAGLRLRLVLFRLICWRADQAVSEFAEALGRARALLSRALAAGGTVDATGAVRGATPAAVGDLTTALTVAERADTIAVDRLTAARDAARDATPEPASPPIPTDRPACDATSAEIRHWWSGLTPGQRLTLLAAEPAGLAGLDGLPAADRDAANRLLLDERRAELDRAFATARGDDRDRLRDLRRGLHSLTDRLATDDGPRAYLLRLDLAGEGRTVVALGDPDRAANVLTHVPGMTADLASFGGELARAERVATRSAEVRPGGATSAVLWLDYDAPDFLDEAASARQADAAAPALRRFQDGLRASHDGAPARQTVLGHSYGSLVVGRAAAGAGLDADNVVFVGSPGVGVDSVRDLHVPADRVWSSTARDDVVQWAAVAPGGLVRDLTVSAVVPGAGPWAAFAQPERDLWFGTNPSDPAFGARVFASQPDGGHLGYWDRDRPALDALAAITVGSAR